MPSETTLREGLHVEALVKHITSDAAAKRYYGADWDKRQLPHQMSQPIHLVTPY